MIQELKDLGYENVYRVPLSGASNGFKHDAVAEKNGKQHTFELKTRKNAFDWLYVFIAAQGSRWSLNGRQVAVADTPEEASKAGFDQVFAIPPKELERRVGRIMTLSKMAQGAEFLVVKSNNKRRLYLKYWGV